MANHLINTASEMAQRWRDRQIPILFIVLFCVAVWGGQYGFRHLWEPDEARFTYISKEMKQRGSWLVPYRDGEFYAHKPPLMFWLINAGTIVTGGRFNHISGRLPSLLGLVLALWAISRIAAQWTDRPTAWRTFFVLCTSSLFWQKGGMGQIDMLLLGLQLTALHLLFKSDIEPTIWRPALAFIFMGLAILAKGPVGLIIPAGIYVCVHLATGQGKRVLSAHWLWGLPLALALPALWLLAAKWSGAPDAYFQELLFDQNLGRLAGKFGGHTQPIYYFLKYLPLDFLPWTVFVPIVAIQIWKTPEQRQLLYRLIAWMAFVVVFFSLSGSKRNLYILSAYPAAAMLVAAAMPRLSNVKINWQVATAYVMIAIIGLFGLFILYLPWVDKFPVSAWPPITTGMVFIGGAVLLLYQFRRHRLSVRWFFYFMGFFVTAEILLGSVLMPAYNPIKTPVELARAAPLHIAPGKPLLIFHATEEILSLYCDRQGLRINQPDALLAKMKELQTGIVVFHRSHWFKLKHLFEKYGQAHEQRVGSQLFIWLVFDTSEVN